MDIVFHVMHSVVLLFAITLNTSSTARLLVVFRAKGILKNNYEAVLTSKEVASWKTNTCPTILKNTKTSNQKSQKGVQLHGLPLTRDQLDLHGAPLLRLHLLLPSSQTRASLPDAYSGDQSFQRWLTVPQAWEAGKTMKHSNPNWSGLRRFSWWKMCLSGNIRIQSEEGS